MKAEFDGWVVGDRFQEGQLAFIIGRFENGIEIPNRLVDMYSENEPYHQNIEK